MRIWKIESWNRGKVAIISLQKLRTRSFKEAGCWLRNQRMGSIDGYNIQLLNLVRLKYLKIWMIIPSWELNLLASERQKIEVISPDGWQILDPFSKVIKASGKAEEGCYGDRLDGTISWGRWRMTEEVIISPIEPTCQYACSLPSRK